MKRLIFTPFLSLALLLFFCSSAHARSPGESDFAGANLMTEQIANWLQNQDHLPQSIGIFSILVHPPLDADFSSVMNNELMKALHAMGATKVIDCEECRTPQVELKGDRLIITKGTPDLETMRAIGKKVGVDSFLTIDLYRTKLSMFAQVTLYDAGSGQVISSNDFKIPVFELDDSSAQIVLKFGPGIAIGGNSDSDSTSSSPPLGGAFQFLEELGFGKGGITIGGAGSSAGSMLFILPTIAWRGRFGSTAMTSLQGVGLGFGKTGSQWGVSAGLSYDVFLGTFTSVGLQGYAVIPTSSTPDDGNKGITAFVGVDIGFSIGR